MTQLTYNAEPPFVLVQQTSPDGLTTRWWFEKRETP